MDFHHLSPFATLAEANGSLSPTIFGGQLVLHPCANGPHLAPVGSPNPPEQLYSWWAWGTAVKLVKTATSAPPSPFLSRCQNSSIEIFECNLSISPLVRPLFQNLWHSKCFGTPSHISPSHMKGGPATYGGPQAPHPCLISLYPPN